MKNEITERKTIMPDIIYEDGHLIVCKKPAGLAVQSASFGRQDLESMVRTCLAEKEGRANPYLAVVHRLDQPVQGLIVFAKTKKAAASLSAQVQDGRMKKEYLAAVCGHPEKKKGRLISFLKKEPRGNVARTVSEQTPGAKRAVLDYEVLRERGELSLLKIFLQTGRFHQIRVQMAEAGFPLYGDTKYNPQAQKGQGLALCASHLELVHPVTGKKMAFDCMPQGFPEI